MNNFLLHYVPRNARFFLAYYFLHFIYLFFFRIVYLITYSGDIPSGRGLELFQAFYLGVKFDLRLCALLTLPLVLVYFVTRFKFIQNRMAITPFKFFSTLIALIVLNFYFFDFGFVSYLGTRINASSLKFLENPMISAQMVWETYPVVWGALATIIFAVIHYFALSFLLKEEVIVRYHYTPKRRLASFTICFVLIVGTLYGKLGHYPLRWSEAYFSTSTFISNFTLNPVLNFFETYKYNKKSFNRDKVEAYYPIMTDYLGVENKDPKKLQFSRKVIGKSQLKNPPNIVIIIMESMAYNKTSLANKDLDATPFLAKLKEESLYFPNFFTPTTSTARGLFATMTGIPDVSSVKTSSRNPLVVNQHTIMNEFKNYERFYFLGGSANWGNIRGIFSYNVDNIKIFEEGSYQSSRNDVWGISDLDLLIEANKTLSKDAKRPFIALVQTAGFHRPYTIPENSKSFVPKLIDKEKLQAGSFGSLEEYNSLRFQDYALGHFMNLAKNESYYKNTIFVIFGDHGLMAPRSDNMAAGYVEHQLTQHHTPLLFHAPNLIEPGKNEAISSQLDVMPTIASFTGIHYINTTLGRNLMDPKFKDSRYAFTYSWHVTPPKIGLISDEFFLSR
jgi:phosphoglycerol transferase MdoB-like AlkP superfamily enzyme